MRIRAKTDQHLPFLRMVKAALPAIPARL